MNARTQSQTKTSRDLWLRNGVIWAALMVLLILTLTLAYVPMGKLNVVAGIAIAFVKSALVAMLYMELSASKPLIRLAACSGFVFATVLFALTLADVLPRFASR